MIIFVLLIILVILVNLSVIYLISQNDKKQCECSKTLGWKRKFILNYAKVSLALLVVLYVIPLLLLLLKLNNIGAKLSNIIKHPFVNLLLSIFIAIGFFNIYFIFKYTKQLDDNKCDCLNNEESVLQNIIKKWLYYYSIAIIIIYIITTILGFSIVLKK